MPDAAELPVVRGLLAAPVQERVIADLSHIVRAQPGQASLSGDSRQVRLPIDARLTDLVVPWVTAHREAAA